MTMKKIIISALALVMAAGSLGAKNLDEARIYINPGHGSWGPNDRPMATIPYPALESGRPDTCGFYESNTNLWKAFGAALVLEKLGAKKENIMYSRVKNGPFPYVKDAPDMEQYNRNLTEICEEVDANNMDFFLSIHSNAATEGTSTNYPLFLYRGKDGAGNDYAKGSYDMATAVWPFLNSNKIDPATAYTTSSNLRGDASFYGSESVRPGTSYSGYLGVLKHGCPGFLSEGYFHTYQPARHRALNEDYCAQEGVRYGRGVASYFGSTGEKVGYIMGYVKDLHEKIAHKLFTYAVGSDDQWLPLNGATVELYKNGTKINTYTVDANYNGVFVFKNLTPGDYTLDYKCAGYKATTEEYKVPVTVKANETSYIKAFLESETYVPPTPPSVIYTNYPDPEQDADIATASLYNFKEGFKNSAIEILAGKTIRRSILRNDSLFVLAVDNNKAPFVYIINPQTQEVLKTLSTTGTKGGIYAVSDISFTADGFLCGCNMEETQFTPVGTFRVYKWNKYNYDEAPTTWFTSQKSGNYTAANTGNTFAITGDSQNCKVITSATTTGSSLAVRVLVYNIENGALVTDVRNQDAAYSAIAWGPDFSFTVSPRNEENIIVDGSSITPIEFKLSKADASPMILVGTWKNADLTAKANGATFFKYAHNSLMVAPIVDADGKNAGIKLFDITNGVDNAKTIKTEGVSIDTETVTYAMGGAMVDNADISMYLVKGSDNASVSNFTTKSVAQPIIKGVYAYDVKMTSTETAHTFNFNATDAAVEGAIVFTNATTGVEAGRTAIANIVKGANSISINKENLPYGEKLNWAIQLVNNSVPRVTKLTDNSVNYEYIRLNGVTIDNSPESDFFGKIYVNNYTAGATANRSVAKGIYAYNPDFTAINTEAYTGGETWSTGYRLAIDAKGKIYMAEWSDPHSGVFTFDPGNLSGNCSSLFRDCTRDGNGLFTNSSGVQVGGSSTGVSIVGSGENTKLYTFDEDYTASELGKGNNVLCYNLGTADKWSEAPNKVYAVASLLANGNCHIVADENEGLWISQTRYNANNTAGVPSLIYVDATGKVLFNSGVALVDDLNGSSGSGFAVSKDGKTLAINNGSSEILVLDIQWAEGVPTAKVRYKFKHDVGEGANSQVHQMNFDFAGNLYLAGKYLAIYSLPNNENIVTTPAKVDYAIDGRTMAINPPTDAVATVNEDKTVTLIWTAPATDATITYNLYLDDIAVGTAEGTATYYTFAALTDGDHTVAVSAIYPNGIESEKASALVSGSSVEDNLSDNISISVYPNPTTGTINIKASEEISSISIFSVAGAKVIETVDTTIDLSDLASGTYFVKVNNLKAIRIIKK